MTSRVIVKVDGRFWTGVVTPADRPTTTRPPHGEWINVTADCGDRRWHPRAEVWTHQQAERFLTVALAASDGTHGLLRMAGQNQAADDEKHRAWPLLCDLIAIRNDRAAR